MSSLLKTLKPFGILLLAAAGCTFSHHDDLFERRGPAVAAAEANRANDAGIFLRDAVASDVTLVDAKSPADSSSDSVSPPTMSDGSVQADAHVSPSDAAAQDQDVASPDADASESADALCDRTCTRAGVGTCEAGTCVVRCNGARSCANQITCPAGLPCRVVCSGSRACSGGVDCNQASKCDIQCSGLASCGGALQCAGTSCTVACTEEATCQRSIACSADRCELACSGPSACEGGAACLPSVKDCRIDCSGSISCRSTVQGNGASKIRCSGFSSCSTSVACAGDMCSVFCVPGQSCGGSVCCQSDRCSYDGVLNGCQ